MFLALRCANEEKRNGDAWRRQLMSAAAIMAASMAKYQQDGGENENRQCGERNNRNNQPKMAGAHHRKKQRSLCGLFCLSKAKRQRNQWRQWRRHQYGMAPIKKWQNGANNGVKNEKSSVMKNGASAQRNRHQSMK
jgi:hypothetical protein